MMLRHGLSVVRASNFRILLQAPARKLLFHTINCTTFLMLRNAKMLFLIYIWAQFESHSLSETDYHYLYSIAEVNWPVMQRLVLYMYAGLWTSLFVSSLQVDSYSTSFVWKLSTISNITCYTQFYKISPRVLWCKTQNGSALIVPGI